jgi:hypothetical protein
MNLMKMIDSSLPQAFIYTFHVYMSQQLVILFDDEPDNVLDHPTLQPGHVDGEEGSSHQHQGVEGEEARLHAPHPGDHDLGTTQHEDTSLHTPHPGDHDPGSTQHEDTSLQATKSLNYDLGTTQHADAGIHVPESRDHDPL